MSIRLFALLLVVVFGTPAAALAQAQDRSHWGVFGSFTPSWEVPTQLGELFSGDVDLHGSEFTVGIARGRMLSGDWGVSYVRKRMDKTSTVVDGAASYCVNSSCADLGTVYTTVDMTLSGVEVHKFVPFGTIKRRVQIGMTFAGGVGQLSGTLLKRTRDADVIFNPATRQSALVVTEHETRVTAKDLVDIPALPLARIEVSVAAIVAAGVKVRASGGMSFPEYHEFGLTVVYLFGAR